VIIGQPNPEQIIYTSSKSSNSLLIEHEKTPWDIKRGYLIFLTDMSLAGVDHPTQ